MRCLLWYRDWDAPPWIGRKRMAEKSCQDALFTAFKLGKWHEYSGICLEDGGVPLDGDWIEPFTVAS